jgi:hypothetical protein
MSRLRPQDFAGHGDRSGCDQHEGNAARHLPVIDPIVNRSALYKDVTGRQLNHDPVVEFHVYFA